MKKIEDILFYSATKIQPPKEGLEKILDNFPVTKIDNLRYNYVMGSKFFLPIGIIALALIAFFGVKQIQKPTVIELPATVTKQNVDDSLNKVDASVSTSINEMDNDLKELDQESSTQGNEKIDLEGTQNENK